MLPALAAVACLAAASAIPRGEASAPGAHECRLDHPSADDSKLLLLQVQVRQQCGPDACNLDENTKEAGSATPSASGGGPDGGGGSLVENDGEKGNVQQYD